MISDGAQVVEVGRARRRDSFSLEEGRAPRPAPLDGEVLVDLELVRGRPQVPLRADLLDELSALLDDLVCRWYVRQYVQEGWVRDRVAV